MKASIEWEKAKEILLKEIQKENPGVTDIVVEGLVTIKQANKIVSEATDGMTSITHPLELRKLAGVRIDMPPTFPSPNNPEMIALVRSLQIVVDDGRNLAVKFLKGKNKDMTFEFTKGLETRCEYCGYIAMSDVDIREHEKTYHKDVLEILKQQEQAQLEKAKEMKKEKIEEHDEKKGAWRRS